MSTDDDYEVGYGRPPRATRFKPGQSGNPRGRPKGARNLATDLEEELRQQILITEAGTQLKVTKQRAMLKTLLARALSGDVRAADAIIKLIVGLLQSPDPDPPLTEDERALIDAWTRKVQSTPTAKEEPTHE